MFATSVDITSEKPKYFLSGLGENGLSVSTENINNAYEKNL